MQKAQALAILHKIRPELRDKFGVSSLALFGSVARDEAVASSDIDVLVDFDRPITLFTLVALQLRLQEALGLERADVVMREALYAPLRDGILNEAINVA